MLCRRTVGKMSERAEWQRDEKKTAGGIINSWRKNKLNFILRIRGRGDLNCG